MRNVGLITVAGFVGVGKTTVAFSIAEKSELVVYVSSLDERSEEIKSKGNCEFIKNSFKDKEDLKEFIFDKVPKIDCETIIIDELGAFLENEDIIEIANFMEEKGQTLILIYQMKRGSSKETMRATFY